VRFFANVGIRNASNYNQHGLFQNIVQKQIFSWPCFYIIFANKLVFKQ